MSNIPKSGCCKATGKFYPSLDNHHIIPVEFGGGFGPTVWIGPDIHQTIHRCVDNPVLKDQFLSSLPSNQSRQIVNRLINTIVSAKQAHLDKGLRKTKIIQVELSLGTYERLKVLAENKRMSIREFTKYVLISLVDRSCGSIINGNY